MKPWAIETKFEDQWVLWGMGRADCLDYQFETLEAAIHAAVHEFAREDVIWYENNYYECLGNTRIINRETGEVIPIASLGITEPEDLA